jgi:RNA polymerase sigma factor (sigma-70 family)
MEAMVRDTGAAASIVRLAAAGDTVAFARIVGAYHADMVRVAYVVSGGQQDVADDAVQAAWSAAWRKLGSLRDPQRLRQWLVSVAANEARQACRRQRHRTPENGGAGHGTRRARARAGRPSPPPR